MGLLDKANTAGSETKEVPPKAVAKKAVAKPIPQTVAAVAKPVKAAKAAKAPRAKKPQLSTAGLPEGYEIATQNSRFFGLVDEFHLEFWRSLCRHFPFSHGLDTHHPRCSSSLNDHHKRLCHSDHDWANPWQFYVKNKVHHLS